MVLPVVVASEMVVCGGQRQRWKLSVLFTDHGESFNGGYLRVEEAEVVLSVGVASEMVACGGRRQRWKLSVLFTDHDESFNGGYRRVEEAEVVLPVVVSSQIVACGCWSQRWKLSASMAALFWEERERESCTGSRHAKYRFLLNYRT